MRRTTILLYAFVVTAAVFAANGAASARTARLQLVTMNPLTVAGTGFRPGTRASVSATTGSETETMRVKVTPTGTFRARFSELSASRCDAVRVVVTRRVGITVVLKRLPPPACQSQGSPGSSPA